MRCPAIWCFDRDLRMQPKCRVEGPVKGRRHRLGGYHDMPENCFEPLLERAAMIDGGALLAWATVHPAKEDVVVGGEEGSRYATLYAGMFRSSRQMMGSVCRVQG